MGGVVTPRNPLARMAHQVGQVAYRLAFPLPAIGCGCPLCNRDERYARTQMRVPLRHPEWVTRELPAAQEEQLAALADELWPDEGYAEIITELRRQEGQP